MNPTISYLGNLLEIKNFFYSDEDAKAGNPYNCSFELKIISGMFSGFSPFEYDIKEFSRFVKELEEMYDFRRNLVELNDIGYGSKISFLLDENGHIAIKGIVYGEAMEHSLQFSFQADQTVLPSFIDQLHSLIR